MDKLTDENENTITVDIVSEAVGNIEFEKLSYRMSAWIWIDMRIIQDLFNWLYKYWI